MALLNYTTTIDPFKTVSEIQKILVKHGAKAIMNNYDSNGRITSLSFLINTINGERGIKLPVRLESVYQILKNQNKKGEVSNKFVSEEQAERIAWRILKDWVESQMAILETEMVKLDQIFLPFMTTKTGETIYELYETRKLLLENKEGE